MIQFVYENSIHSVASYAPSTSLLQYLRLDLVRTGTKEGCASGDCGACTVALGEWVDGAMHYTAINACITPLASIHGKHLITVESLSRRESALEHLHPVQRAMVECHGSQCGFCTPGIIMSLYVWWLAVKSGQLSANRHSVEQALSGNLCRCTGYQPILRAAAKSLDYGAAKSLDYEEDAALSSAQHIRTLIQKIEQTPQHSQGAAFMRPTTSAELVACMAANPKAQLVAGATDLALEFTQALKQPNALIYTREVAEFNQLDDNIDNLSIGAGVSYSRAYPLIAENYPAFAGLIDRLGSLQIRNQATLGGNIANASPIGDTPPVLLALNAMLTAIGPKGEREIPIDQFFTGYRKTALHTDEALQTLVLPKLGPCEYLRVYKISKRFDDDISAVCLAIWLQFDRAIDDIQTTAANSPNATSNPNPNPNHEPVIVDIRIGAGGMAATPARALNTENALRNTPFDAKALKAAKLAITQDFTPLDDVRASAQYRLAVAGNLLERCQQELLHGAPPPPWEQHAHNAPIVDPSDASQPQSPLYYAVTQHLPTQQNQANSALDKRPKNKASTNLLSSQGDACD